MVKRSKLCSFTIQIKDNQQVISMNTTTKVHFKIFGISFEITSRFIGPRLRRFSDGCVGMQDQYMIVVKSDYHNWSFIYYDWMSGVSNPVKVLSQEQLIRVFVERFCLANACHNPQQREYYSREVIEQGDCDFDNLVLLVGGEPRWLSSVLHEIKTM